MTLMLTYPLDLIHTRTSADMTMRGQDRLFTTTFDCFNRTNLDEKRIGLYKGIELAALVSIVRSCIQLPIYEACKKTTENAPYAEFNQRVGASMLSGLICGTLLYPVDTAKRCVQLNGGRGFKSLYKHAFECLFKLGSRNYFRGVHLYVMTTALASFVQFSMFDYMTQKPVEKLN